MIVKCYLLTSTEKERRWLRRFVSSCEGDKCPGKYTYHNAMFSLGDFPWPGAKGPEVEEFAGHPGWPTQCDYCAHAFSETDYRQVFRERLYTRSDTGAETTLHEAEVGAMWLADWFPPTFGSPIHQRERPGQPHLIVRCPGHNGGYHDWDVDAKSSNGDGWSWTGTPPMVTATPSIGVPGPGPDGWAYHGWLRNGELVPA